MLATKVRQEDAVKIVLIIIAVAIAIIGMNILVMQEARYVVILANNDRLGNGFFRKNHKCVMCYLL